MNGSTSQRHILEAYFILPAWNRRVEYSLFCGFHPP
jgi:hypothetical protein